MGVIEDWKDEYAEAIKSQLGTVYHHVHPRVSGAAHCDNRVRLDVSRVKASPPADARYCERCEAISSRNLFLRQRP